MPVMSMLMTAAVVFISVVLKLAGESAIPQYVADVGTNTTSPFIPIPSFVDMTKVYDARNLSVIGYSTMRSIREFIGNAIDIAGAEDINVKLNRVDFKMSSVCHAQDSFGVEIVKTIESIWNSTMDRSPFDGETFLYGTFDEESVHKIPRLLIHLERQADNISHELGDLGDRIAGLVTSAGDEFTLRASEEYHLLGESLVQFISSVLFVGNISLSISAVHAYLLQLEVQVTFLKQGDVAMEAAVLETLERLYVAGLTLIVPGELKETVCRDVLL